MADPRLVPVARVADVPASRALTAEVGGRALLVCLSNGHAFALDALCPHAAQRMDGALVRGGWIACPVHGARFDLATGRPLGPPASSPVKTYPARIAGEWVEVELPVGD